jgi:hypothetical protein
MAYSCMEIGLASKENKIEGVEKMLCVRESGSIKDKST